ncbi:DUF4200 domain-containing protein [Kytococcus sedentarius]|uniref:S1 motif domain-containing protein n=1 Tax=Kytococcus sedentarius (strain ATCC 14392 / DSM 20547 / JCM 11482 / CCUG 33030 / NBRC 15357 / NCTC 11040 / CCM 314 / 541) TaxID=478801 RepID=C7NLY0_KYTSD|nr:DUF4200 domain-containing protein [Kytococcus sedentarius]ACV07229.1 hypothetical protein Ksed_22480 [Kytococcus sedentarius DSM 20547]QQB63197.1 DUF4200 domain-containing protein [Kytococcus sedentarius]STX13936.1 Uncharacterised protein [Kytococcus sedentarius]
MAGQQGVTRVETDSEAAALRRRLLDPQRRHPLVVLTEDAKGQAGVLDPEEIHAALRGRADVCVVAAQPAWELNAGLPGHAQVFGGAGRVFPALQDGKLLPPLAHKPESASEVDRVTQRLITEAKHQVAGRRMTGQQPAPATTRTAAGHGSLAGTAAAAGGGHTASPQDPDALAEHLLDPARARPVVVVTAPLDADAPLIDVARLREEAGPDADVEVLTTRAATWRLTERLQGEGVYGGAGRVYPPGTDWLDDGRLAPLRLGQDERQAQRSTEALSRDLVNALVRTGGTSTTPEGAREVTGTVRGVVGGRGLVELDGGGSAVLWPELVAPGVPAERIVAPGQRVTGWFDATRGRVDVTPDAGEHAAWWRARVPGEVVLARVAEVSDATMELEPAPGVTVAVGLAQVTGNELDRLRDLVSPGEVLAARVVADASGDGAGAAAAGEDGTSSALGLSLLDVDDDEAVVPAPALLPGGPPWLDQQDWGAHVDLPGEGGPGVGEPGADGGGTASEGTSGAPGPGVTTAAGSLPSDPPTGPLVTPGSTPRERALAERVLDLQERVKLHSMEAERARRQVEVEARERQRTEQQVERLRRENREARTRAQRERQAGRTGVVEQVHGFADPARQLRWELERTWVETTRPEDKATWPLPASYRIGPAMADSLRTVQGVSRDRVLRVAVAVLTGRGVDEDHVLRRGDAGNAPAVTREDGAVCRRAPLQQKTPSARRLSYWRLPDGTIELSRVALHDDLEP